MAASSSTSSGSGISPDPTSEAGRLAQKSVEEFRAADATSDPGDKARSLREAQSLAAESALAAAYSHLRKAVGLIAVSLPFVVAVGNLVLFRGDFEGSISAYYHTHMGDYFVGSLFALAVFFLSYNYRPLPKFKLDNILSTFASVAAVGVAFFPTASDAGTASGGEKLVSTVHLIFAAILFGLLAVFSLFLFTMTGDAETMTAEKKRRNVVYRASGGIIVGSMLLVLVSNAVHAPSSWHSLFWLETVAVVAFGVSWLVKGGFLGILADKKPTAPTQATGVVSG
jgi:hypothetical protein